MSRQNTPHATTLAGAGGVGAGAIMGLVGATSAGKIDAQLLAEIVRAGPGALCVLLFLWLLFVDRPAQQAIQDKSEERWAKALADQRAESRQEREAFLARLDKLDAHLGNIAVRLEELQEHIVPGRLR